MLGTMTRAVCGRLPALSPASARTPSLSAPRVRIPDPGPRSRSRCDLSDKTDEGLYKCFRGAERKSQTKAGLMLGDAGATLNEHWDNVLYPLDLTTERQITQKCLPSYTNVTFAITPNVGLMLGLRRRRWHNVTPTSGQGLGLMVQLRGDADFSQHNSAQLP